MLYWVLFGSLISDFVLFTSKVQQQESMWNSYLIISQVKPQEESSCNLSGD